MAVEAVAEAADKLNVLLAWMFGEKKIMEEKKDSTGSIIAAVVGNVLVAIVKFIAGSISNSSAMISEGIHSLVDSGNGVLVYHGLKISREEPSAEHPFGRGKELYFWTLIVSILIFALGGCLSIYKGAYSILHPHALEDPFWSFITLIAAMIIEGWSLTVAVRHFNSMRKLKSEFLGRKLSPFQFIKETKDPSVFTVVLEDAAAEVGLLFALIGLTISTVTGDSFFDSLSSVLIGTLLIVVSFVLLKETKSLLIGEGISVQERENLHAKILCLDNIEKVERIASIYFGPEYLVFNIDLKVKEDANNLPVEDPDLTIGRVESKIREVYPQAKSIYIEF